MHFTLWPSLTAPEGASTEVSWTDFLAFVGAPVEAENKNDLEGFSLAKFKGDRRAKANVLAVSALCLDDDSSGLGTEALARVWGSFAGVVFTTFSHALDAPRHRVALRLSRDVTGDEYPRVWAYARKLAAAAGQVLDEAPKDASRLWFVPARRAGGVYEVRELAGAELDVEAALASVSEASPTPTTTPKASTPATRTKAAAAMLGAAWPAKGRHEAQRALAGALKHEGWSKEEALEFLCSVCRAAGDEDRTKRVQTIEHTWSTETVTGWPKLKGLVDGAVVTSARDVLSKEADFKERIESKLASVTSVATAQATAEPKQAGPFTWDDWTKQLEPPKYLIHGYVPEASVGLLVAHGDSLKTWTALSMALAVASGKPWLDVQAVRQGSALIADFESGNYELARRVQLLGAEGANGKLGRWCFPKHAIDEAEFWEALIGVPDLRLVVIDALASGTSGVDENDARAADPMKLAAKFAELTGAAVLFIHHARKGSGGDNRERVRGTSALFAAADWAYDFEPLEETETCKRMRISCIKMSTGRKPPVISIELTDKGLTKWEDEAREAGQKADTPQMVRAAVKLALMSTDGTTATALVKAVGRKKTTVLEELRELIELREAVRTDKGFTFDSDERRAARVVANVTRTRWSSAAQLAKASYVTTRDVEAMQRAGVLTKSAEGVYLLVAR